jgi:hypothetical protein
MPTLLQQKSITALLERFWMSNRDLLRVPRSMPSRSRSRSSPRPAQICRDQQLVEGLLWASTLTSPDIVLAINHPALKHHDVHTAKLILKYLKGTKKLNLTYKRQQHGTTVSILEAYADSELAGETDSKQSVTGCPVMLKGATGAWQSMRQLVAGLCGIGCLL